LCWHPTFVIRFFLYGYSYYLLISKKAEIFPDFDLNFSEGVVH